MRSCVDSPSPAKAEPVVEGLALFKGAFLFRMKIPKSTCYHVDPDPGRETTSAWTSVA